MNCQHSQQAERQNDVLGRRVARKEVLRVQEKLAELHPAIGDRDAEHDAEQPQPAVNAFRLSVCRSCLIRHLLPISWFLSTGAPVELCSVKRPIVIRTSYRGPIASKGHS